MIEYIHRTLIHEAGAECGKGKHLNPEKWEGRFRGLRPDPSSWSLDDENS